MKIETLPVGALEANCYLITKDEKTVIIDPGDEISKILEHCKDKNIVGILVTHHHFDHVGALTELEKIFSLKHNPGKIEDFDFQVLENKGHSKDSVSFYFETEKILFSGDFIFYHTIGRCDLEGGNFKEMQESIQKILTYPEDIIIYPGHGKATTLKEEKPYLKQYLN